jgi:ubiquinone/menaquinone biosynthesis C-methylase UbiE
VASSYEAWYATTGLRAARLERALLGDLLAALSNAQTILDVGCGTGHFSRFFRERGLRVVGADPSMPMLRIASQLASPPLVAADGRDLPFEDGSFEPCAGG